MHISVALLSYLSPSLSLTLTSHPPLSPSPLSLYAAPLSFVCGLGPRKADALLRRVRDEGLVPNRRQLAARGLLGPGMLAAAVWSPLCVEEGGWRSGTHDGRGASQTANQSNN